MAWIVEKIDYTSGYAGGCNEIPIIGGLFKDSSKAFELKTRLILEGESAHRIRIREIETDFEV